MNARVRHRIRWFPSIRYLGVQTVYLHDTFRKKNVQMNSVRRCIFVARASANVKTTAQQSSKRCKHKHAHRVGCDDSTAVFMVRWDDYMLIYEFICIFFLVSKSKANIHVRCNQQVFVATRVFSPFHVVAVFPLFLRFRCSNRLIFIFFPGEFFPCHIENRVQHFFSQHTNLFSCCSLSTFPVVFLCHLHFGGVVGNAHA